MVHLNNLKNRAFEANDDTLRFLIEAAVYYIEEVRGPPWDNPLVVACYYKSLATREGKEYPPEACLAAVKAYELEFKALLEKKTKAFELLKASPAPAGQN